MGFGFMDSVRDFFGAVYVEEENGVITIGGISSDKLLADINKIWGNTRVVKLMFTKIRRHSISFYSFFGVDVLYIYAQVNEYKKRVSSKYRVRQAIDLLKTETWLKRMDVEYKSMMDMKQLDRLLYTLRPHQLQFLEAYDQKVQKMGLNGFLLAAAPGAGKTLIGLALTVVLDVDVAVLLAPKSILDNVWTDGVIEQFEGKVTYWVSSSGKPPTPGFQYYITHFDALNKLIPIINNFKGKKSAVILDESHNFNDSKSVRSRIFVNFCHRIQCKNVVFSSGTPIKAMGFECITLLQCIDPLFTPEVEAIFRQIFGVSSKRAIDILRHRIDLIGHKIPREVFMSVAKPIVQQLKVKLPGKEGLKYTVANVKLEMKAYIKDRLKYYHDNMRQYVDTYDKCVRIYAQTVKTSKQREDLKLYVEYINEIRKGFDPKAHKDIAKYCNDFEKKIINPALDSNHKKLFKDARSIVKYVNLKVLGEALGKVLGRRRAECHCDMIPHSGIINIVENADKKTLCFSSFVSVLETAEKYFTERGLKPTMVHGQVSRSVDVIIKEFKSDPNVNPILATLQSMSAGITLVNCSVCIFLDLPFRSYIHEQGGARVYRIGQDAQTYLVECTLDTGSEPNISSRSQDIMEWSRQQVELIMGRNTSLKEMSGIVQRLNLNPETRVERILHSFQDLFKF